MGSQSRYFSIVTLLVVVCGVMLFAISFYLEALVFTQIAKYAIVGIAIALALDLAKVVTIIVQPIADSPHWYGRLKLGLYTSILRVGLIVVSLVCSAAYLSTRVDRPHMASVRADDIAEIDKEFSERLAEQRRIAEKNTAERIRIITSSASRVQSGILDSARKEVERLADQLHAEMEITDDAGNFIGRRYRDIHRRLDLARENYANLVHQYSESGHAGSKSLIVASEDEWRRMREKLMAERDKAISEALANDYANDERVSLPVVTALKRLSRRVLGGQMDDIGVGLFFAALVSLIVELGIVCIFTQHASVMREVLRSQFELWQYRLASENRVESELARRRTRLNEQKSTVKASRSSYEQRAREALNRVMRKTA